MPHCQFHIIPLPEIMMTIGSGVKKRYASGIHFANNIAYRSPSHLLTHCLFLLILLLLRLICHSLLRLVALLMYHLRAPVPGLLLLLHEGTAATAEGRKTICAEVAMDVVFRADVTTVGALEETLETNARESGPAHTLWERRSANCSQCSSLGLGLFQPFK